MYFRIPVRSIDHVETKTDFDGEYGCEERQPGEKEKCLVILVNEEGEEKTFEAMRTGLRQSKSCQQIRS